MEKALLIVAIILLAVSVALGIASLLSSKKKSKGANGGGDIIGEIDTLNNNLNEVKNIINDHITKEKDNLSSNLTNVINASNNSMAIYMNDFKDTLKDNLKITKETLEDVRREMKNATADMSKGTAEALESLKKDTRESLDRMSKSLENSLDKIGSSLKDALKDVRDDNKSQLASVQKSNEEQLEKIRMTVDEKLNETLDKRIKNAFEMVNTSLSQVQQGFGEMRELTGKVTNLNKMFTNVKMRGGWGEVALESLLDQILSPEQYERQFRLDNKSREMVDFAIVMPGQGEETVYLPIDSKFPLDKYINMVEVSENGDAEKTESARKELFNAVKDEAKDISKKYIIQGVTTRFAVMYLPSEGLYAEIAKNSALTAHIQNEYHVTVCGPTTITALLNSLQMGFTTLKIQKRSGEIAKALQDFQKDFAKYTGLVSKIKNNANLMVNTIGEVEKRNDIITRRLAKVSGELPQAEEEKLIASDVDDIGE